MVFLPDDFETIDMRRLLLLTPLRDLYPPLHSPTAVRHHITALGLPGASIPYESYDAALLKPGSAWERACQSRSLLLGTVIVMREIME